MKRSYAAIAILTTTATAFAFLPAWAAPMTLDPTFSHDGIKRWDMPHGSVDAMARDHSQIVVAGGYTRNDSPTLFVSRLNSDGSFDDGFGDHGTASVAAHRHFSGTDLLVLDDSSVVAAIARKGEIDIYKWTAAGERDTTFSGDGRKTLAAPQPRFQSAPHLAVDTGSRILVGGMVRGKDGVDALIARLLPDGSNDDSLSGNGRVTLNFKSWDWVDTLATDDADRILLGTDHWNPEVKSPPDYGEIVRLRKNGSLDASFGVKGRRQFRLQEEGVNFPIEIEVGKAGVIDVAAIAGGEAYGALRLFDDGSLDRDFGHDGRLSLNCECWIYDADIVGGHFAFAGTKGYSVRTGTFEYKSKALLTRINRAGTKVELVHQDLFPDTTRERVNDVVITGSATVLGGEVQGDPFLTRFD